MLLVVSCLTFVASSPDVKALKCESRKAHHSRLGLLCICEVKSAWIF